MILRDWKFEAEQYRDIDKAAREKAEAELAQQSYRDAITGADPDATKRLNKALRRAWQLKR